jgi:hypothetical protein
VTPQFRVVTRRSGNDDRHRCLIFLCQRARCTNGVANERNVSFALTLKRNTIYSTMSHKHSLPKNATQKNATFATYRVVLPHAHRQDEHTNAHTHANTHAHTRAHTRTHAHTNTYTNA